MNAAQGPSQKQVDVLKFINDYLGEHDRSPTYRDIQSGIGAKSTAVASHHVRRLLDMDLVERTENVARGLSLTDEANELLLQAGCAVRKLVNAVQVPVKGVIQAGKPVESFEHGDEDDIVLVNVQQLPRRRQDLFAVRVRGDSMIDALVQEDDVVVLQKTAEVKNGDMVAAWLKLEQETTLKYFFRDGDTVQLRPANKAYEPINVPAQNVEIQGKVVLVHRQPNW